MNYYELYALGHKTFLSIFFLYTQQLVVKGIESLPQNQFF